MTSFKISFASDSIEGVSSLVRFLPDAWTRESVSGFRESSPPPAPGLQGSDGSAGSGSNQGETTPPPMPALPGASGRGDSDQGGVAPPPVPGASGRGDSDQGGVAPPPVPGASGRGDSDQGGVAPPPVPPLKGSGADSGPADSAGEVGLPPSPDQKAKVKKVTKAGPRQEEKSS